MASNVNQSGVPEDSLNNVLPDVASVSCETKKNMPSMGLENGHTEHTIAIEDPPSFGDGSDEEDEGKPTKKVVHVDGSSPQHGSSSRARRAWDKRVLVGGVRAIPFWTLLLCFFLLCTAAIVIPTLYMGMGPPLAQKSVSNTYISLHNIRVSNWSFTQYNASDPCEIFHPSTMTITQDILFEHIPWYGRLGPTYIEPSVLNLTYNGTEFAKLHMPEINLCDTDNGNKWSNNTPATMVVTDVQAFINANADLIPLGSLTRGWTIWHQSADIILRQKLGVVTSYYPALMTQDVNVSNPQFLDGPLNRANLLANLMGTLNCVQKAKSTE